MKILPALTHSLINLFTPLLNRIAFGFQQGDDLNQLLFIAIIPYLMTLETDSLPAIANWLGFLRALYSYVPIVYQLESV